MWRVPVAQWIEHQVADLKVEGSSPFGHAIPPQFGLDPVTHHGRGRWIAPDWIISLLRYVGLIISIVVFFLGVIWAAFDGRKQGWHDKIACTLVFRDPA